MKVIASRIIADITETEAAVQTEGVWSLTEKAWTEDLTEGRERQWIPLMPASGS